MKFEFDETKSEANKRKHGIDFVEAQALWKDPAGDLVGRRSIFMKTEEFDRAFDEGQDISKHLDLSKTRRPAQEQKRVNVDLPLWMIQSLDKEAKRLGVTRQSIIKGNYSGGCTR